VAKLVLSKVFKPRLKKHHPEEDETVLSEDKGAEKLIEELQLSSIEKTEHARYESFTVETQICRDSSGHLKYIANEPTLTNHENKLLHELEDLLVEELNIDAIDFETPKEAETYLANLIDGIVKKYHVKVDKSTIDKIRYYLTRNYVHYGKIDLVMRDPDVEDISCNGPRLHLYVWHRKYESIPTNVMFSNPKELDNFVVKLADMTDKSVSIAQPVIDANLPDGSRLHATYEKAVTRRGSSFTIRKFHEVPLTVIDLVVNKTLSARLAAWFWYILENQASLIVVGGTASGKTTTINALAAFIKPNSKIVSIEDTAELELPHENWLPSVTRTTAGVGDERTDITLFDLLRNALRQRPDYIMVGEVRGSEAYTLFQAVALGHGGIATFHAESVESAVRRFESEPLNIPRPLMASVDVIAVQGKVLYKDKMVRRIVSVSELFLDPDTKDIKINTVAEWDPRNDSHIVHDDSWVIKKIAKIKGYNHEEIYLEIARRIIFIEWLVQSNINNYNDVFRALRSYYGKSSVSLPESKSS